MNSEKDKKKDIVIDLIIEMLSNLATKASNKQDLSEYLSVFYNKVRSIFPKSELSQKELLQFIIQNKPKDIIEIYHLMNMFMIDKNILRIFL